VFLSEDASFLAIGNPRQLMQLTKRNQQQFLADPQQLNSYSYGRGNPITVSDPTGNAVPALLIYAGVTLLQYGSSASTIFDVVHYLDVKANPNEYPKNYGKQPATEAGYSTFLEVVGSRGSRKQQIALDVLGFSSHGLESLVDRGDEDGGNESGKVQQPSVGLGPTKGAAAGNFNMFMSPRNSTPSMLSSSPGINTQATNLIKGLQVVVSLLQKAIAELSSAGRATDN
jgi:hypothetical protein